MKDIYQLSKEELFKRFNSSEKGLSEAEAVRRIKKYGLNQLEEQKESVLLIFFRQFNNPLVYILIAAMGITVYMGDKIDAGIIGGIILVNGLLGFFQELKARASIQSLKKMTETKATVIRDGEEKTVPVSQVTVGDIVVVREGDVVPADIRLIDSSGLLVEEAVLTGESVPVEKDFQPIDDEDVPLYRRKNVLFKGTIVVRGWGVGIVYAVGKNTEIGKIAEKIKEKAPESPLNKAIKKFSLKWMLLLFGMLSVILVFGIIQGRDLYKLFMLIISELVSAVPEGLPLVITFVLVIGAVALAKKKTLVKYLPAVETLGSATYILSDKTGTITEGKLKVEDTFETDRHMLFLVSALCNDASGENGDPLEVALLKWLENKGYDWKEARQQYPRVWEYPFDTNLRLMATVNIIENSRYLLVKGAFESLKKMAVNDTDRFEQVHDQMAEKGLRVLAFGYSVVDDVPESIENVKINIVGLVGFLDPPKEGVKEAVETARKAGIRIIMVTGDNIKTAVAVAKKVSIYREGDVAVHGTKLKEYSDEELYNLLKMTSVVARATPEDKYRLVKLLQRNGEIVAVTGDGVNDVPALKVADLGIAMGSGTEAAKDVAKMIITDNNLSVIVEAVKQGRIIALNIRKVIYYLMSCSFGEILLLTSSFLLKLPLPLYPIQILWINVVTEGVQDKTFAFNKPEENIMDRKPEKPEKTFFDRKQLLDILFGASLIAFVNLLLFIYALEAFSYEKAVTLAFTSLIANQWINGFQAVKSEPYLKNLKSSIKANPYMFIGVGIGVLLQLSALYIFPEFMHAVPLSLSDWGFVLLTSIIVFFILELKKLVFR
ncbi:cation-translocating P-type ATPase [Persephonella sp.]